MKYLHRLEFYDRPLEKGIRQRQLKRKLWSIMYEQARKIISRYSGRRAVILETCGLKVTTTATMNWSSQRR